MVFMSDNPAHIRELARTIDSSPQPTDGAISLLAATHGDERLGLTVLNMAGNRVRRRIAHLKAAEAGVRYLNPDRGTSSELMAHYRPRPAHNSADPQDRAAAANLGWLGARANNERHIVYDIHSTPYPTEPYMVMGQHGLRAAIAGAYFMGYRKCIVHPGNTFYQAVRNGIALEQTVRNQREEQEVARAFCTALGIIATQTTDTLWRRYGSVVRDITFYRAYDLPTTDATRQIPTHIYELEAMPTPNPFDPVDIPQNLRKTLGIRGDTYAAAWGYCNQSMPRPNLGRTALGVIRREHFGMLLEEIPRPTGRGPWIQAAI